MKEKYYEERETVSLMISIVGLFLTIYIIDKAFADTTSTIGVFNRNFVIYAVMCILFFLIYGISFFGGKYVYPAVIGKRFSALRYIAPCGTALFMGGWLLQIYFNENMLYPENSAPPLRHEMPVIYACVTLVSCVFFTYFLWKKDTGKKIPVRILFAVLIAFAGGVLLYTPVLHRGDLNAYLNSIYETLNDYPYTDIYKSIYGHYAILYAFPIKMLGGSINDVYRVIAVAGFITFAAVFIALANVIKRDGIYFLTCIAIVGRYILYFEANNYYQAVPHRWLFPALFILLWSLKKAGKGMETVSYILLVLAIVWNLDSGLVLAVAYSGYRIYEHIRERGEKKLLLDILLRVFLGTGCFFAAYSVVGIYNISVGGKWGTVKDFIYPYLSDGYHIANLMLRLPGTGAVYGILIAVMLGIMAVSTCRLFLKRADWKDGIKFFVALTGSGMMFYYINRPTYNNVVCSTMECTFLLGIFLDETVEEFHMNRISVGQTMKKGSHLISYILGFFILLFMSSYVVETAVYYGKYFHEKMELHNLSEINSFADEVAEKIPEDTFAFGWSIQELYYQLGWDTGCHVMDWADLDYKSMEYIRERIMTGEMFLTEESSLYYVLPERYYPKYEQEFIFEGSKYCYARLQYMPEMGNHLDTGVILSGISEEGWLMGESQFIIQSGKGGKVILKYEAEESGIFRIWINGNETGDYKYTIGKGELELNVQPESEARILIFLPYNIKEDGSTGIRLIDAIGE